ncbi:hypothetical protein K458DRAFT_119832 [Lentithecium fluviatile CBS 122367]|uniref:Uncharacterized protein n=1 Tax=Lentithecium fluviatile CBS 122367 TaxID=1168545 RepID=A0A6G1ILP9_9PLEO|nr:hypothetical protein K458DRAFT_119832 [Lentithecium fluviatile CBS 122367]
MKFTIALIAGIFSTAAVAAPAMEARETYKSLTFRITNDLTGRNAAATVLTDGMARNLIDLFRGSAIQNEYGAIIGTSVDLTGGFTDATRCFFQDGNTVINFNGKATHADLDGNPAIALPVYMNNFNIQCV